MHLYNEKNKKEEKQKLSLFYKSKIKNTYLFKLKKKGETKWHNNKHIEKKLNNRKKK
jgi:hypothetical protein